MRVTNSWSRVWWGGLVLATAAALLLLIKWLARDPTANGFLFVGRFHPLLLHLPIGFLVAALMLGLLSRVRPLVGLAGTDRILLAAAAVSGLLTAATGLVLGSEADYEPDLLQAHETLGIILALAILVTWLVGLARHSTGSPVWSTCYLLSWAGTLTVLFVGAHYGGTLTHGQGYLTKLLPPPLATLFSDSNPESGVGNIDPATDGAYQALVRPVLAHRCGPCHAGGQTRGGLSLDTMEGLRRGGADGPVLSPGSHAESELMRRVYLPLQHRDHMPPVGRPQLTPAQAELVRWWIDSGADSEKTIRETAPERLPRWALGDLVVDAGQPSFLSASVPFPDGDAIRLARTAGFSVSQLISDSPFLQVQAGHPREAVKERELEVLKPLAAQIVWLDLAGTSVSADGLQSLGSFVHLSRLHLERTSVTDDTLRSLAGLRYLEYLNVYGTAITDRGLDPLEGLPGLKTLCIWQTAVTDAGVERLKRVHPGLEVVQGSES